MTEARQWRGVLKHLAFLDNLAGQNGLATWGVEDDGWWKFDLPFVNRRNVEYEYGEGGVTTGGSAWEVEVPGPAIGLPPLMEGKLYVQRTTPDVGVLIGGKIEISFKTIIERLGVGLIMNSNVQNVLGRHWAKLFPIFDTLAKNAPAIEISGAFGLGAGIATNNNWTPYVRLLTTAEMNFNPNLFQVVRGGGAVARVIGVHELDMTGGRGGGRSWQISSLANIPSSF